MSGGGARPCTDLDLLVIGDCNPDVVVLGEDVTPAFGQQEKLVDSASMVIGMSPVVAGASRTVCGGAPAPNGLVFGQLLMKETTVPVGT